MYYPISRFCFTFVFLLFKFLFYPHFGSIRFSGSVLYYPIFQDLFFNYIRTFFKYVVLEILLPVGFFLSFSQCHRIRKWLLRPVEHPVYHSSRIYIVLNKSFFWIRIISNCVTVLCLRLFIQFLLLMIMVFVICLVIEFVVEGCLRVLYNVIIFHLLLMREQEYVCLFVDICLSVCCLCVLYIVFVINETSKNIHVYLYIVVYQ